MNMPLTWGRRTLVAPALLAVVIAACGAAATPAPTSVNVSLQEWAVLPAATSTSAGKVTFVVKNTGPKDVHEFVVIKTDLDAFALPTDATGAANEEGAGMEVMGEVEDLAVGASQSLALDLKAGHYVLICNIYNEDEKEAHYKMGMAANFTVD